MQKDFFSFGTHTQFSDKYLSLSIYTFVNLSLAMLLMPELYDDCHSRVIRCAQKTKKADCAPHSLRRFFVISSIFHAMKAEPRSTFSSTLTSFIYEYLSGFAVYSARTAPPSLPLVGERTIAGEAHATQIKNGKNSWNNKPMTKEDKRSRKKRAKTKLTTKERMNSSLPVAGDGN